MNAITRISARIALAGALLTILSCDGMLKDMVDTIASIPKMTLLAAKSRPLPGIALVYDTREIAPDETIDMGYTFQGDEKDAAIIIRNTGSSKVTIDNIIMTGLDARFFSTGGISLPAEIEPGTEIPFSVSFKSVHAGDGFRSAALLLKTGIHNNPYRITVACERIESNLAKMEVWRSTSLMTNGGTCDLGSMSYCIYKIINRGTTDLVINSAIMNNGTIYAVPAPPSDPIGPNESAYLMVTFEPTGAGTYADTMTLAYNDSEDTDGTFTLDLTGTLNTAPVPEIEVSGGTEIYTTPHTHSFGKQHIDTESGGKTFQVKNIGTAVLNINSIAFTDAADPDNFNYTGPSSGFLLPGESTSFTVHYYPRSTGSHTATVSLASNDPDQGSYTINLTGTAQKDYLKITVNLDSIYLGACDDTGTGADLHWKVTARSYQNYSNVVTLSDGSHEIEHYTEYDLYDVNAQFTLIPPVDGNVIELYVYVWEWDPWPDSDDSVCNLAFPMSYISTTDTLNYSLNGEEKTVSGFNQTYAPWVIPVDGITHNYYFHAYGGDAGWVVLKFEITAEHYWYP